jgi:hypothetical protein
LFIGGRRRATGNGRRAQGAGSGVDGEDN